MQAVVRPSREALWSQPRQINLGQDPVRLGHRLGRGVIGQRDPRRGRCVIADGRIVIFGTEPICQPTVVLAVATARDHGVNVQLVDGPAEAITGTGIGGGALGQQDDHDTGVDIVVADERDSGRSSGQAGIQPEVADLGRVGGQQRRETQRLAGGRFAHLIPSLRSGRA